MTPLIDTHAHLDRFHRDGSLDAVLARARGARVDRIITIGTEPEDWKLYASLVPILGGAISFTVGLHPCSVDAGWESAVAGIEAYFDRSPRPVAIGECGLDRFHLPKEPADADRIFAMQREAFAAQLAIAKRRGLPVVVHSRGAFNDCVAMIDATGADWSRVVFHCFSDGEAEMRALMERGGFGSFTGILTYKNAEPIRAACRLQGIDRLMVETDAPYLAPVPNRGKPNEPAWVRFTADCAAAVLGVSVDEAAAAATRNSEKFFGLPCDIPG
jgi:TatD DNase family protein